LLKAKCNYQIGHWLSEKMEKVSEVTIKNYEEVIKYYNEAIHWDPEYQKAWHSYALFNYEAADLLKKKIFGSKKEERPLENPEEKLHDEYIKNAFKGFIYSISLGSKNIFQETLRLLQLLFNYGYFHEIADEFRNNYKKIDICA